ncbi:hypothetical protein JW979_08265, partial [bacterium]|nr:hypothetical protein [candidate division CSSED10-310 bacterium]
MIIVPFRKCIITIQLTRFIIFCIGISTFTTSMKSETPTEINGQYYLRGLCHPSGEVCGTGYDIGKIKNEPPEENGERNCASWIMFRFDPQGFFPEDSIQIISNIYYHVWWRTDEGQGILGYETNGLLSDYMDEYFTVSSSSCGATVDSYSLQIYNQMVSEQFGVITGEDIYNFTIKLSSSKENPSIKSSKQFHSFIIINPDDPEILETRDSDSDGLNDRDEMYLYYTDPLSKDTDGDGYEDFLEAKLRDDMNPNDPEDPPVFNRHVLASAYGNHVNGALGTAMCLVDNFQDYQEPVIIVSEPGIGRLRIYDKTLNYLSSIDYGVPNEQPGSSIATLKNTSGNLHHIAVGAPGWNNDDGRVYIFDSNGTLQTTLD